MLKHADHVCFIEKHFACNTRTFRVGIFLGIVDLDCDVATVVRIVRQVDHSRAALPDLVDDDVLTDLFGDVSRALDIADVAGHVVSID